MGLVDAIPELKPVAGVSMAMATIPAMRRQAAEPGMRLVGPNGKELQVPTQEI